MIPPEPTEDDPLPILATAVVPWTSDFRFEAERFARQVATIARHLTRRIYIFGTAGEGHAVTDGQFDEIARCFATAAREHGVRPMLGVISLSCSTMVERIERGRAMGFREFQISLPSWGALNEAELDLFFRETCGRFPDCSFLHYNLMRSRRVLTADDYARQLAVHPNLVAIKMSSDDPDVVRSLMALAPRLRCYFTELGYARARRIGPCGLLVSLASVQPERAHEFVHGDDARREEDLADLRAMGAALGELAKGRFHMDGAYDKLLFRLHDPGFPLRLLPPYAAASEQDFEAFRASLPLRWRLPATTAGEVRP